MYTTVIINDEAIEIAIKKVNDIHKKQNENTLNGILDAAIFGKMEEEWENFTKAIHETFIFGKEYTREKIDRIITTVEGFINDGKQKAREIHNWFKTSLQVFMKSLITAGFQSVPESIVIGTDTFTIQSLSCNQKIGLGGSLKANFMEAVELTANGEIEIGVSYGK